MEATDLFCAVLSQGIGPVGQWCIKQRTTMNLIPIIFAKWIASGPWLPSMMAGDVKTLLWLKNGFHYEAHDTVTLYKMFLAENPEMCQHEAVEVSDDGKDWQCKYCKKSPVEPFEPDEL